MVYAFFIRVVVKILVHIFFVNSQGYGNTTLLDHNHFFEFITIANDYIIRQENPWLNIAEEFACKFTTSLELSVIEKVEEICNEIAKKTIYETMSESRFHLHKEFAFL